VSFSWGGEVAVSESVVSILSYLATASFAAGVGHFFTARHYRNKKRYEFSERRLNELYGPLLSRIEQLGADGRLRFEISQARSDAWKDNCDRAPSPFLRHEEAFEPYKTSIDYENRRFRESMELYEEMLSLLHTKRHLAFDSTLGHYEQFFRFVELWRRWLDDAIPWEAIQKVETPEEELHPFYADVRTHHSALVRHLSGDRQH